MKRSLCIRQMAWIEGFYNAGAWTLTSRRWHWAAQAWLPHSRGFPQAAWQAKGAALLQCWKDVTWPPWQDTGSICWQGGHAVEGCPAAFTAAATCTIH